MSTFAVFGNSLFACEKKANKKVEFPLEIRDGNGRYIRMGSGSERKRRRDSIANELFSQEKIYQISQAFDAPQFAKEWIELGGDKIKNASIKCRVPKVDKLGRAVLRKGAPVLCWRDWDEVKKEKGIK